MTLTEFLAARIGEDEASARRELGRHDVVLVGTFAPARVLAECRAKRWIVEALAPHAGGYDPEWVESHDTLQCLASVYSDHPDYQQEWKP